MTSFVGLGPMPGIDPRAAAEIIIGECLDGHVALPLLPARGLGADLIGRTAVLMADLNVDRGARSWKIADRVGRLQSRARDFLARDIDACEELWETAPQLVRLVAAGPWTMAASVETAGGRLVATDPGAVSYFAESLAAGLIDQAADVRRRFDCAVEVLLVEPMLSAVASGTVRAPSMMLGINGYLPAVGSREIAEEYRRLTSELLNDGIETAIAVEKIEGVELSAIADSGVTGLWIPHTELSTNANLDFVAAAVDKGIELQLGIVPVHVAEREEFTGAAIGSSPRGVAEQAARLWEELGYSHQNRASKLSIAPVSGFAHSDVDETIAQLRAGRETAELMRRAAGDL
ncbi:MULTISPECIES: uroporphyrinogen decarboxylase/cobalamine-independent methonine synthase family protein [Corynebacterium]|uniref:Methionine synthase n=1 Tax=Corynebacterium amycolatum TaxID=43765 RepID=A0AB38XSR0_CORAY|nr:MULTISPECIES: methionine synthase [Corynebacterium]MBC6758322.1 methionine synthase [Corynebacterium sp. LK24]AIN83169.1 putative secreted methionine synthase [Corynebacterium sp. ATCC 6931]MBC6726681.1 methionine synthase [Corynebacterium amycolatum]MDY7341694.1 methionine synthase [Corynebacterium amycolatum]OFU54475.1 methionine synthase [Corynebacterium sp. HMSC11H10]